MKTVKAVIFDFDDTIAKMPTKINLYHTQKCDYLSLSTSKYAKYKHLIGKEGILKHCKIDANSFEEFCSSYERNFFVEDMVKILNQGNDEWKAMYFEYFIEMLSTEEDSENVYIVSARAHDVGDFIQGMRILQTYLEKKHNKKIFLPKREHLRFVGKLPNIPLAKASAIESIVRKESGENTTEIEFADDDHENVVKAETLLSGLKSSFGHITFFVSHVLEKSVNKIKIK